MRFYVLRPPTHTPTHLPTHPPTHPRRLAHVTYRLEPRAREDAKVYLRSVPHVYSVGSSPGPEPTQKCTSEVYLISWEKSRARAEEEKKRAARAQKEKEEKKISARKIMVLQSSVLPRSHHSPCKVPLLGGAAVSS